MDYVEHLNLFGIEFKEIPCIKGKGAPTTQTVGAVGLLYMDTDSGAVYKCVADRNGLYIWELTEKRDTVTYTNQTLTGVEKEQVRENIGIGRNDVLHRDELTELWAAIVALQSTATANYPQLTASVRSWSEGSTTTKTNNSNGGYPSITEIHFVNTYAETGSETEKWTVPTVDSTHGTISGYRTGNIVTISANGAGKIKLNRTCIQLFSQMTALEKITGIGYLDASEVVTMNACFYQSPSLKKIDLFPLCAPNLENISGMFKDCDSLEVVRFPQTGLSNIDLATGFRLVFDCCNNLRDVDFVSGLTSIPAQMFHKRLALERVHGLDSVTTIGEQAFTYASKLTDTDLNAAGIKSVGADACRLSSLEDNNSLKNIPNTATVGDRATRHKRWTDEELTAIGSVVIPKYVYLEVPNMDSQSNYTFIYGTYQKTGEQRQAYTIARGGCSALNVYHEWQAIHHKYGGTVYANFKAWWDAIIGEGVTIDDVAAELFDPKTEINDIQEAVIILREKLGWTSGTKSFVTSAEQKQIIIDRLSNGLPVQANIYSSNTVGSMHAGLIIGMNPDTQKFAILDPNVIITPEEQANNTMKSPGVVSWLAYEDIFMHLDGYDINGKPVDNEFVWPVETYDVPTN